MAALNPKSARESKSLRLKSGAIGFRERVQHHEAYIVAMELIIRPHIAQARHQIPRGHSSLRNDCRKTTSKRRSQLLSPSSVSGSVGASLFNGLFLLDHPLLGHADQKYGLGIQKAIPTGTQIPYPQLAPYIQ